MQGIWTKYDPVAFHYFAALEAHLRSKNVGRLHEDLLVKSRKLSKRSRDGDNSGLTTFKRASWCCYVAFDMLLEELQVPVSTVHHDRRPLLTTKKLAELKEVLGTVDEALNIELAEHDMDDPVILRGSTQVHGETLRRRKNELEQLHAMVEQLCHSLFDQSPQHAGGVGSAFFRFLVCHNKSHDDLVRYAERLERVQDGR